jgi:hypothetical protein
LTCHHGAVRIRAAVPWLGVCAAIVALIGVLLAVRSVAVVAGGVALVALAGVVMASAPVPGSIRWPLVAGVLNLAVALSAWLTWWQTPTVRGGWFAYAPLDDTAAMLRDLSERTTTYARWASVATLIAAVLFGAAVVQVPRHRPSRLLAVAVPVAAMALVLLATIGADLIRATRSPVDLGLSGTVWLQLAATTGALGVAVLAVWRTGSAAPAALGAVLLAIPSLAAVHQSTGLPPLLGMDTGGGRTIRSGGAEMSAAAFDLWGALLGGCALAGVAMIVAGCLRATTRPAG